MIVLKYTFNIGLRQDTWEPICFKFGIMPDKTNPYVIIPVWMALTFTELWES